MDSEISFLELKGLSKAIRTFHVSSGDQNPNNDSLTDQAVPTELWTKFFKLHVIVAREKIGQNPLFQPWILYVNEALNSFDNNREVVQSHPLNMQEVQAVSQRVITEAASYYKLIAENQLSFLNTHSITFSQDYLSEALDYYSFWHAKFDKMICRSEANDIDVILLVESLKIFNKNHAELQNSVVHWPLPLGCHHPKLDNTLEMFLLTLPSFPIPINSSTDETADLTVMPKTILQQEYTKAHEFITAYMKQLEARCKIIFPMPELLGGRFRHYKVELDKGIHDALAPIRSGCEQLRQVSEITQDFVSYLMLNEAINAKSSCMKLLVVSKRRVKEAVLKFLLYYYRDALRRFKKYRKIVRRLQKRNPQDLSLQLQLQNRIRAFDVWRGALSTALSGVREGRCVVISNVYQAQFYFLDFLDEAAAINS